MRPERGRGRPACGAEAEMAIVGPTKSEAGLDTTNLDVVKLVMIVSYLLTFVVGFTGNTLVLYVVGRFPVVRRKSVANYYIWNLALADELYVLALPLFCWATYR